MLKLNFLRICAIRGIGNPYTLLVKNGFSHFSASSLVNDKIKSIKADQLYKLCVVLNCTPNDLFEYVPKKNLPGHPLNGLIKEPLPFNYLETIRKMPLEDLKKIEEVIMRIKGENDEGKEGE